MHSLRLVLLLAFVGLAAPAFAETIQDRAVRELVNQGFDSITMQRTLLGRVRIIGVAPGLRREIVVNLRTGEVLRDYTQRVAADNGSADIAESEDGGSTDRSTSSDSSAKSGDSSGQDASASSGGEGTRSNDRTGQRDRDRGDDKDEDKSDH